MPTELVSARGASSGQPGGLVSSTCSPPGVGLPASRTGQRKYSPAPTPPPSSNSSAAASSTRRAPEREGGGGRRRSAGRGSGGGAVGRGACARGLAADGSRRGAGGGV